MDRVKSRLADDATLPTKDFEPNLVKYKELQDIVSLICILTVWPYNNFIYTLFGKLLGWFLIVYKNITLEF